MRDLRYLSLNHNYLSGESMCTFPAQCLACRLNSMPAYIAEW